MNNRWSALALLFLSFLQLTLNWFDIIPLFSNLITEMRLSPLQVGGIPSAFMAGYGLAHIPGGVIAERWGMRAGLLLGIAIEGLGAAASATAHSYEALLAARFLCGVGGSLYIGSALGVAAGWFRERELATANGMLTGVAYSIGAAIALYGWGLLGAAIGWREALLCGAGVSVLSLLLIAFAYPTPPLADIGTTSQGHSLASLRRSVACGRLWLMSFAFYGGYGAYFTAIAMLPSYAVDALHLAPEQGHMISATLLLSGIAGSFLGGWLSDRVLGFLPTFLLGSVAEALALLAIPYVGPSGLQIVAGVVGGGMIVALVAWIGLPGLMTTRFRTSDIPTAVGLMLTLAAVAGVIAPPLYAEAATYFGPTAGWSMLGALTLAFSGIGLIDGWRRGRSAQPNSDPVIFAGDVA